MVKLPDSNVIPTVGLRGQRPGARIDSAPIARGAEAIGQAETTGGEAIGSALANGGTALGSSIVRGGEQMASAEQQGGAAIAGGLQNFGKGVENVGSGLAEFKLASDRLDYARAQSEFRTKKIELDQQFANDTDYATLQDRYSKKLSEIQQTTAQMIGNDTMRQQFSVDTTPLVASGVASASQNAFNGLKGVKTTDALSQLDDLTDAALRTKDPNERAGLVKTANGLITSLQNAGFIDAGKAQQLREKWTEKYAKSQVAILPDEEQINMLREAPTSRDQIVNRITSDNVEGTGKNPNSSATGTGQFIDSTWLSTLKAHRPDIAQGRTDAQLLALRNDPALGKEMTGYLADDNSKALRAAGVVPTPTSIYLAHFLGAQGAIDVMKAKPGTPVDDVLDENAITANQRVLGGKTTDGVIAWAQQKMGGATRGRGDAIDFIPETDRVNLLNSATARYLTKQQTLDSQTAIAQDQVKEQITGDVKSMLTYGTGDDILTPDLVRSVGGSRGVIQWQDARNDAHAIWLNTHDLSTLPVTQISQRMSSILPKAGDPEFARKQKIYDAVKEQADAVMMKRQEDPAASVADDPMVKQAAQGVDDKDPSTFQPVIKARLVAQDRAGIPKDAQSPITKNEALAMTAPLRQMLPGQERQVLTDLGKSFKEKFGDNADQAFAYALRTHKISAETAQVAARVVKKLAMGQTINLGGARSADNEAEISAADNAMNATAPTMTVSAANMVPGFGMGPMGEPRPVEKPVGANVPAKAIRDLRANPALAADFDKKYGAGTSKKILENYSVR